MTDASATLATSCRTPRPARAASARRVLLTLFAIVPLALIFGSLAGFAIGRVSAPATSYREQRLAEIAADLRRVDGDYLLASGDSHIARWQPRELCGLPVVNAGVEGATAGDTDAFLAELSLPRPPRAIILTVGTNDANSKRFRDPPQAVIRFRQAFQPLLERLTRTTALVIVTGVPRIDAGQIAGFSAQAGAGIGAAARAACRRSASCRFAGSFSDADTLTDGLHLADYAPAYDRIAPALCAAIGGRARAVPMP